MSVVQACLWGLLGVALIEVYALWNAATADGARCWPWRDEEGRSQVDGYAIALACRVVMGVGLNAAYAAAHQIEGPLAAVTMGVAAPLIIRQMVPPRPEQLPRPSDAQQPALPAQYERPPEHVSAIEPSVGGVDAR